MQLWSHHLLITYFTDLTTSGPLGLLHQVIAFDVEWSLQCTL